jgi:HK97 family phage major capsid protein
MTDDRDGKLGPGKICPRPRPAAEVKSALAGFRSEFKGVQGRSETKLATTGRATDHAGPQDDDLWPPGAFGRGRTEAPHQKAFDAYLRSGDDDGLRGLVLEGKAMNTAVAADGGYLVDPQTADTIRSCCCRPRRSGRWPMS